ncbi:hypothetical protein PDIG_11410 [Penicillium digitatum PHI26]|uniref:Uncharacterized protein n=2 Tax=Penicillium digitatum TaxID=36651 RepID=K9GUA3_PEND2|nr:hypothetical protein PDIP_82910 [Penicillium digitatum Pd1]EKV05433.1 hypothetical protein PDIP_82910 [Penicillium digitatum Pd1]EKV18193.1 hypothetical protein PDIG_11410 [Penicillium digitatum PHI26]
MYTLGGVLVLDAHNDLKHCSRFLDFAGLVV